MSTPIPTTINLATIKQSLNGDESLAKTITASFMQELPDLQSAIEQAWLTITASLPDDRPPELTHIKPLERKIHKLKGASEYVYLSELTTCCKALGIPLRHHLDQNTPLTMEIWLEVKQQYQSLQAMLQQLLLSHFLDQWDQCYQEKVTAIPLFQPDVTQHWQVSQQQQFARLFYHVRGHFYKFLWLLGNESPNCQEKEKIIDNIREEFGQNGLSMDCLMKGCSTNLHVQWG